MAPKKTAPKKAYRPPTYHSVFAYGSNMNEAQMRARCPRSKLIGVAGVSRMRLAFAGYSQVRCGAVATMVEDPKAFTTGLLWLLDDADLARLDTFEGCPVNYRRESVSVLVPTNSKKGAKTTTITAQVYLHQLSLPLAPPAPTYLALLRGAYRKHRFDEKLLDRAVSRANRSLRAVRAMYPELDER